ncbi:hypothetical protein PN653_18160 [Parabacteroides distasonis]|uniref:hypothetical protein n=1 Tax=Parabacteroides distasonis TaxID=823 RepID=UPI00232F747B|nr:hypothetical protein [Parabacteroides distasonis]MDB9002406.1 hypothetical protein [Parabacteroides distasonis]MDB9019183.1 hypothetical protein [Parabacteroides distasonis]MDB9056736.1 hypothetical protein [Parabacteroides distasonis]
MMRRYTLYNQLMAVAAGLCLCWLCVACGEDRGGDLPNDDPNSCVVTITLWTSRSARPPQTKAGETITWEDDDEYERDITDWLVVAYDDENAELAGYTSREGTWTPDVNDPDDSHTEVEMRLPLGKYSFYAFANLQSLEDGTSLYQKITGAHSLAELSEVKILDSGTSIDTRNEEKKGKFGGEEASRKRIPMSSYAQEYTLKPAPAENKFEIPLIRMIGKVQVKITNNLDKPITVKQLDIMNLRKGSLPIWLLPWGNNKYLETAGNDGTERLAPDLPTGEMVAEEHLFDEKIIPSGANKEDNIVPAKIKDGAEGHNIKTYTRYIPEGNAGAKEILLGVDIEGRPRTEHTTSFGFVRRNDLLIIPVLITNITTKLEVAEQRLPIGVYPTALVYGEKTGVQILTPVEHTLQAAGDLSIRFEISNIDGVTGDFSIKGYEVNEGGNVATEKYSSVSWENASADKRLITAINVDGTSFETDAELDIPEAALTGQGGLKKAGSFTIRTQELGGEADATVVLTLVIKYGENMEQEMQIPYTIQIRNYEKQQQP